MAYRWGPSRGARSAWGEVVLYIVCLIRNPLTINLAAAMWDKKQEIYRRGGQDGLLIGHGHGIEGGGEVVGRGGGGG